MSPSEFNDQLKLLYAIMTPVSDTIDIDLKQFEILTKIYPNDAF